VEKCGIKVKYEIAFGGSDVNTFVNHKLQVVNIGDGGKDPHIVSENVSVSDLEKLTDIFVKYISV